ncbi:hypothetical protein FKW77_010541 [Venturia effusa]|uniref:Ras modification protein ERF4 n=1 Tax=Venturia effusa TaxID=50376 RepID=A0A517L4K1_9PEZI|nr:hypothetical protein FKW77_010541 [Venturia effusa]
MANLALQAIAMGADKIPDKAFHAVPGGFFRPPNEENPLKKRKKKKKDLEKEADSARDIRSRDHNKSVEKLRTEGKDRSPRDRERDRKKDQHNHENSTSESDTTEDEAEDEEFDVERQPRRRNRKYRPSSRLDRGYSSDRSAITHDPYRPGPRPAPPPTGYFPPPPVAPVDEDLFQPKKYSPTEYGASPGERDHYYTDHPKEQQPYPAVFQEPVRHYFPNHRNHGSRLKSALKSKTNQSQPSPTAENTSTKRSLPADIDFARTQAPSPTSTAYFPQQPIPQAQPQQQVPFRSRPISGAYIPHAEYMASQNSRPYAAGVPPAFVPAPTFANGPAPRVFQPQPAGYPVQSTYVPPTDPDYKPTKDHVRERGDKGDRDRDRERERERDRDHRNRGDRDRRSSRHTNRRHSRSASRSPSYDGHRRHHSSRGPRDSEHRQRSRSRDRDRKSKGHRTSRASSRKGSAKSSGLGALAGGLLGKELGAGKLGSLVTAALGGASANDASKESRSKSRRREDDDREHRHRSSRDDRDKYEGRVQYGGGDYDADSRDDGGRGDRKSKDFTNWTASTRPLAPHGAARLWNPSNYTPRTLAIPHFTSQHPDLNTEQGTRPTTAGAYPLLTLPEQRRSRQSLQDSSLVAERSSGEHRGKTIVKLPEDRRREHQRHSEHEPETGEAGPGPSTTAARVDALKESMERKADSLMPEAASPQDLEGGRTKSIARSTSRASIPMSRHGTGEPQGLPDEEEFSWGPNHPCYPHLNPHVPLDSPLHQSTRIIRIRRDWMQVGDLAPTFANLYPEILDHLIEENEFREIIKAINDELIAAFSPYSTRAWIDTIMGVATFWLWEDVGLAGVKSRLENVEKRIEKWNRDVGIHEGVSIISLRRTAYLNLDIQIPDPQIGLEASSNGSRPDTRNTNFAPGSDAGATERTSFPQVQHEQQTLPRRLAV